MSKRTLDQVLAAVRQSGVRITEAEETVLRRRLAPSRAQHNPQWSDGVGVDPLAGTETDPVAAVQRVLDERVGVGTDETRRPTVAGLFGGDIDTAPEHGDEPEPPRTIDQPVPRDADPAVEKPVDSDAPQPPEHPTSTPEPVVGKGAK